MYGHTLSQIDQQNPGFSKVTSSRKKKLFYEVHGGLALELYDREQKSDE